MKEIDDCKLPIANFTEQVRLNIKDAHQQIGTTKTPIGNRQLEITN